MIKIHIITVIFLVLNGTTYSQSRQPSKPPKNLHNTKMRQLVLKWLGSDQNLAKDLKFLQNHGGFHLDILPTANKTLEAIKLVSTEAQNNYTSSWLIHLIETGVEPNLSLTEEASQKENPSTLEQRRDALEQIKSAINHNVIIRLPETKALSKRHIKAQKRLNHALKEIRKRTNKLRLLSDTADNRAHEAMQTAKLAVVVTIFAEVLELLNIRGTDFLAKVGGGQADDVLSIFVEFQNSLGSGFSKRDALFVLGVGLAGLIPATILALWAQTELSKENPNLPLGGFIYGASAVTGSATGFAAQFYTFFKKYHQQIRENKVPGRVTLLAQHRFFQQWMQIQLDSQKPEEVIKEKIKSRAKSIIASMQLNPKYRVENNISDVAFNEESISTSLAAIDNAETLEDLQQLLRSYDLSKPHSFFEALRAAYKQDFSSPLRAGLVVGILGAPFNGWLLGPLLVGRFAGVIDALVGGSELPLGLVTGLTTTRWKEGLLRHQIARETWRRQRNSQPEKQSPAWMPPPPAWIQRAGWF